MAQSAKLQLRQTQGLALTPQLMQSIKLLQMSAVELNNFVQKEIEKNPLLELGATAQEFPDERRGQADNKPDPQSGQQSGQQSGPQSDQEIRSQELDGRPQDWNANSQGDAGPGNEPIGQSGDQTDGQAGSQSASMPGPNSGASSIGANGLEYLGHATDLEAYVAVQQSLRDFFYYSRQRLHFAQPKSCVLARASST